jgi:hypothetical protein
MSEHEFELYLELLGKFLRLRPGQRIEIADELRDHLEARLEELSRGGMSRADAVRRALDEFGDAACLADHFSQLARERKKRFLMRCTLGTVSVAAVVLIIGTAFWPQHADRPTALTPTAALAKPDGNDEKDAKDSNKKPTAGDSDPDDSVNHALDTVKMTLEFSQAPAADVLQYLSEQMHVDVVAGGSGDQLTQPITLLVKNTQLTGRAALNLVLEQVGLSYIVRDGLIRICHPEAALTISMIDVRPLLGKDGDNSVNSLVGTIQSMVQPNNWVETGGYATISVFNGLLIVRHTPEATREVHRFVEDLRNVSLQLGRSQ